MIVTMKRTLLSLAIVSLFTLPVYAFSPIKVQDIRIEGNTRIENGTVFSYLPIKVGDSFGQNQANSALKTLFATGLFQDVRIETEGDVVVVVVQERPIIGRLQFSGMKEFPEDDIKKAFKEAGFAETRVFNQATLDLAVQELKKQYFNRGKYAVRITPEVTVLEHNRVAVKLTVSEGLAAKIKEITLVGNQSFTDKKLRKQMQLDTTGWFSWFNKNDRYAQAKLGADIESLRSFYMDRGFIDFDVTSSQVAITPDKKQIFLGMNLTEGQAFQFSEVSFAGDTQTIPEDELKKLVSFSTGEVFIRSAVNESIQRMVDKFGEKGYAFANINAVPELNRDAKTVAFTFYIDPAKLVYVRRININGNTKTRDVVVRREFRQVEGGLVSTTKIKRSKERLAGLGYFEESNVDIVPVAGSSDQIDLEVNVKEKQTGNFTLGAGFGQGQGVVLSGSVTQQNVFGSGNYLSLNVNTGKLNKTLSLSYVNPYYTIDGVSRGFDLYLKNVDPSNVDQGQYSTSNLGAKVRYALPVNETDVVNVGLGVERSALTLFDSSPTRYKNFVHDYGDKNTQLLATVGWQRDRRDSLSYPTKGGYQRLDFNASLPGSHLKFYRLEYQQQHFFPLSKVFTLMLNGELDYGGGYGGQPLPFFQNFQAGGEGSVRGFKASSLGVKDANGDALGGNKRLLFSSELLFPLPNKEDDKSLRLSVFVDAGTVWAKEEKVRLSDVRVATGVAFTWVSPLGPMKLSYGLPLRKQADDKVKRFQFTLGQIF